MGSMLILLFAAVVFYGEAASVIGIDFGSANIKIGIIRGGQRDTVLNKEGKRKVAALAGLNKHGDRVFSAAAEALLKAYPNLVQRYSKHLLGRRPDHPWIVRNKDFFTTEIVADSRGTAAVPMGVNQTAVPALEIISWLFKEAKEAARHHVRASVVSAVIAVPPFFTQWERAALLQAAKMAGLEVLSLVNEGTAVAIDYFVSRTIGEEPKLVMLYDMGDVSTKVTLVQFDREKSEKAGGKDTPQATVVDVAWDDSLGGRNFDENLAQHFLAQASKQSKLNVGKNARAVEKLRAEAQKVKEILSANSEYEANLEGLIEEFNFNSKVTRIEFERLNAPLFSELLQPIKALLENNKLTIANISEIQILGGGTRVPKVREVIASFFQRTHVDAHLNGDEAICSGAAFYAAMKSPAFKKQNFKFRDLTLFPVSMSHPSLGSEPAGDAKLLFGFQNKLFSKKVVSFTTDQPVWMRLKYEIDAGPRRLPAGTPRELVKVELNAVDLSGYNVTEKKTPKVSIAFRLTSSGTVEVESAETDVEVWELPPPPPTTTTKKTKKSTPAPSSNGTAANETTAEETTTTAPTAPPVEYVRVNKTVPLTWKETWLGVREYSSEEMAKIVAHTTELEDAENDKVMRAEAVNDLEGFVYATRERLTDDDLERHATEKEREDVKVALTLASDYLETDEAASANSKVIRLKLTELKELWRPLERRIKLFKDLPGSFTKCRESLVLAEKSLDNITLVRMVNETEVATALEKINTTRTFLDESEKKFRAAPENVDPAVIPTDIQLRCDVTKGFVKRLHSAPKRTTTKTTTTTKETETPSPDSKKEDL